MMLRFALASLALCSSAALAAPPVFEQVVLEDNACKVAVYAVTIADVDGDKKDDVVAVTENRVLWYRNPDWKRHIIIEDQTELDNVCIAPYDIDGDGKVDFALGAGWLNGKNLGTIQWLSRGKTLEEKWSVHSIAAIPWTHRMRFGDVLGTGKSQLTVSPLNAPMGKGGVELTAFSIPANPKTDPWPREVLNDAMNRMHNHWHVGTDNSRGTLTASQEGVFYHPPKGRPGPAMKLSDGAAGSKPELMGAGEIKTSRQQGGRQLLATIEPMHGNQAVVYVPRGTRPGEMLPERVVLTDQLKQGHAVYPGDFDGDGDDDVAVGWREAGPGEVKGPGILVFENVAGDGTKWQQHVLDNGGMAAEDIAVADLDGDGLPEIIGAGRSTKNVKLYRNKTPKAKP
jgi:hypothetical protein